MGRGGAKQKTWLGVWRDLPPATRLLVAETAFERALEIDPDLREAALMLSRLKGGETPERP